MPDLDADVGGSALVELAVGLARQAGTLLLELHATRPRHVATKSTLTDMVTEMDRTSERLIVDGLLRARPDDGILGEEGSAREGASGVRWIIDPLDGTTNYLYGHFAWAVSIAAEVDGEVVAGVVVDASHDEVFTAQLGGGARCNGQPIAVSGHDELATALVGTGFAYAAAERARQAVLLERVLPNVRDIRRNGSAALDLCWVACGRLDAHYEQGLAPWDLAAGELIAREAGARTSDFAGHPARPGEVVAATPAIADALLDLLVS